MKKYVFSFEKIKTSKGIEGLAFTTELYFNGLSYGTLFNNGNGSGAFLDKNYNSKNHSELDESKINFMARQIAILKNEKETINYSDAETLFVFYNGIYKFIKKGIKQLQIKFIQSLMKPELFSYVLVEEKNGKTRMKIVTKGEDNTVNEDYKYVLRFDNEQDFIDKYLTLTFDEDEYSDYIREKEKQKKIEENEQTKLQKKFTLDLYLKIKGEKTESEKLKKEIFEIIKTHLSEQKISFELKEAI